eukprot:1681166-Rhodomonas_salina.2
MRIPLVDYPMLPATLSPTRVSRYASLLRHHRSVLLPLRATPVVLGHGYGMRRCCSDAYGAPAVEKQLRTYKGDPARLVDIARQVRTLPGGTRIKSNQMQSPHSVYQACGASSLISQRMRCAALAQRIVRSASACAGPSPELTGGMALQCIVFETVENLRQCLVAPPYRATRALCDVWYWDSVCYAMSGTGIACDVRCPVAIDSDAATCILRIKNRLDPANGHHESDPRAAAGCIRTRPHIAQLTCRSYKLCAHHDRGARSDVGCCGQTWTPRCPPATVTWPSIW